MGDKIGVGTFITDEAELTTNNLDIFGSVLVDKTLKHGKTISIHPLNALSDSGPFEFTIHSEGSDYTYLPLTRLEGEIEVVKTADGTAITDAELIAPVNLFPNSLFRQIECEINNQQISDLSTATYAYKSFIETHLSYGDDAKNTHLKCEMYKKDTVGKENTFTLEVPSFKNGVEIFKKRNIYFSSIIHLDFFQCQRYLLPGCTIKLKFIRNDDTFSLLGANRSAVIKIKNLNLTVRRITLDQNIHDAIEKRLEKSPAQYPIVQSKIKTFLINSGIGNITIPNIIRGTLPRSLIFGFVDSKAFDGNVDANPFCFSNMGIKYFNLKINGEPVVGNVFQPDFETSKCIREYRWFMDNCGILHENETNGITFEEFKSNTCFWVFDLSPDLCNSFHRHESNTGYIDLDIAFKANLTNNITMIAYSSFNELVLIDKERNVILKQDII